MADLDQSLSLLISGSIATNVPLIFAARSTRRYRGTAVASRSSDVPMSSTGPTTYQIDRERLVEEHRSFVRAIASELIKGLPRYIEFEELTACGNLGLVEAAQRYDPRYRTSFRTFT